MATAQLPSGIQEPLLALDRKVRDAIFSRGLARSVFVAIVGLSGGLFADWILCLGTATRSALLSCWLLGVLGIVWFQVIRPAFRRLSLSELAAIIERNHPELRERLVSLVEFRELGIAPGTSKLMRDLMTRQTIRTVEQIDLSDGAPANRSGGLMIVALMCLGMLFVPFCIDSQGYGLLWARFFVPWGNFSWGEINVVVPEGDQIIARGKDASIRVQLRKKNSPTFDASQSRVMLNWRNDKGIDDSRRMEWDSESSCFQVTLPHLTQSIRFHASTTGGVSRDHAIHVADPPVIAKIRLDVEPPPYTKLAATTVDGGQGEVRVADQSRIRINVEFESPVSAASLAWPEMQPDHTGLTAPPEVGNTQVDATQVKSGLVDIRFSADRKSGVFDVVANVSGKFSVQARNAIGLKNDDVLRSLVVDPDLPPSLSLDGLDQPVAVKPHDRYVVKSQAADDYGLTCVELHLETSTGVKRTISVADTELVKSSITHDFVVDLSDFDLGPGQAVSYRIRAVDNRPEPNAQETWTTARTLMIQSTVSPKPDLDIVERQKEIAEELADIRSELADSKEDLQELHALTEKESLKQKNSDKSDVLDQAIRKQEQIAERLRQLSAELEEGRITENLADDADQIANEELAEAKSRIQEAKQEEESRDQLEPISQAIDQVALADKQLQKLQQKIDELQKLERDLAQLDRLANNAERLAENLESLQKRDASRDGMPDPNRESSTTDPKNEQVAQKTESAPSELASKKDTTKPSSEDRAAESLEANGEKKAASDNSDTPSKSPIASETPEKAQRERDQLQSEAEQLVEEFNDLLNKHPELIEAARQAELKKLQQLAEQARDLSQPQQDLADALKDAAMTEGNEKPADAERAVEMSSENARADSSNTESPTAGEDTGEKNDATKQSKNDSPEKDEKDSGITSENPVAKRVKDAIATQGKVAQQAAKQAKELSDQFGQEADVAKAASEFATDAAEAADSAKSGNLDHANDAAKSAAQAAKLAAQTIKQSNADQVDAIEKANELAQQQSELSKEMESLSRSEEASREAQRDGQQQISRMTKDLAQQFDNASQTLNSLPGKSESSDQRADLATNAAKEAQKAMEMTSESLLGMDSQRASEQASAAAERLRQAAENAEAATTGSRPLTDVPSSLGNQVAEAARQLNQALGDLTQLGENMAESGNGQPVNSTVEGGKESKAGSSIDKQSGSNKGEGTERAKGGNQSGNSASDLSDQAAKTEQASKSGLPTSGNNGRSSEQNFDGPDNEQSHSGTSKGDSQSSTRSSRLAEAARQFRGAAASLREAQNGRAAENARLDAQLSGNEPKNEDGQPLANADAPNQDAFPELKQLDSELKRQSKRDWGKLPGTLKTEILQGANKKPHPEYSKQIKSYFEEIAKPVTREKSK